MKKIILFLVLTIGLVPVVTEQGLTVSTNKMFSQEVDMGLESVACPSSPYTGSSYTFGDWTYTAECDLVPNDTGDDCVEECHTVVDYTPQSTVDPNDPNKPDNCYPYPCDDGGTGGTSGGGGNNSNVSGSNQQNGQPYIQQPGDKLAKPNLPTTMSRQVLNTCTSSGFEYISKICGDNKTSKDFEDYYYKQWGEFLVLTGVPYSRMTVFGSHFFETTNYVGFNQAIDLGYLVMTNLNAGNGDYHNVVVVGYHQNGDIIYMDPIYGSLRESPITDFPKNYVLTIKKCK